jgi:hypothetical protein
MSTERHGPESEQARRSLVAPEPRRGGYSRGSVDGLGNGTERPPACADPADDGAPGHVHRRHRARDPERWGQRVAVIDTVKQVGTGVLDGLAAMSPGSTFIDGLGRAGTGKSVAVAGDFEPESASLPVPALDTLVDPFFGESNDLVVPTKGISQTTGQPLEDVLTVPRAPAISQLSYFGNSVVRECIAGCCPRRLTRRPPPPAGRRHGRPGPSTPAYVPLGGWGSRAPTRS